MPNGNRSGEKCAFVVMQIGNAELNEVYREAIAPAIVDAGLVPRRVDKHNSGGLLKSEIVSFIEGAEVIVADLTNERQNCYLEVGYALRDKGPGRVVLTAREDHLPDSPRFTRGGPKIHFDLAGYDILTWSTGALEELRSRLTAKIKGRLLAQPKEASFPIRVRDAAHYASGTLNDYVALKSLVLENVSDSDVWRARARIVYFDHEGEVGSKVLVLGKSSDKGPVLPARTTKSWSSSVKLARRAARDGDDNQPLLLPIQLTEISGKANRVEVTVVQAEVVRSS